MNYITTMKSLPMLNHLPLWLLNLLSLPGSWAWAVKQLRKGYTVRPASASGTVKYRYSTDEQFRLQWSHSEFPGPHDWSNAYFFDQDLTTRDWVTFIDDTNLPDGY